MTEKTESNKNIKNHQGLGINTTIPHINRYVKKITWENIDKMVNITFLSYEII